MTTRLQISPTLSLPLDFVTSTQAILAKKGSGKSYTASVQAEELLAAGQQIVVIDPTGAWFGLRSSADGKSPGFPIAVLGGEHGDVPLEVMAGEVIADAIASEHFSAVLDLSLFRKAEANRFMGVFLETLYRRNRDALHVFIDEADTVAPQRPFGEEVRTLGATEDLVRRGRIRGLGATLITQRPQVLNKNVLSQVDMLTALRMNHPKDLAAIREWVDVHADLGQAKDMIASLPGLPIGEAWIWAPAADLFERVKIRRRTTFDSGATPKAGAGTRSAAPRTLAPIDLSRLGKTIAATVERAKANDPAALRARIAELEKRLAARPAPETRIVEKRILTDAEIARLEKALERFHVATETLGGLLADMAAAVHLAHQLPPAPGASEVQLVRQTAGAAARRVYPSKHAAIAYDHDPHNSSDPGDPRLTGPERRILEALTWMESIGQRAPAVEAVAFLAQYTPGGGAFDNTRGALRSKGLVEYPTPGTIALTAEGRAWAPRPPAPGSGDQLRATVLARLAGPERRVLEPLIAAYPEPLTTAVLATRAGYAAGGGAFDNARGRLRTLGLADYPRPGSVRAADLLFPGAAP